MRTRGESASTSWTVRAREARIVGAKVGPFRFLPVKTLELQGLHLEITEKESSEAPAATLHAGVTDLGVAMAGGGNVSRVMVHDLHIDIRGMNGELKCCVAAGEAKWSLAGKQGSDISLEGSVAVTSLRDSLKTERATLLTTSPTILASHWGPDEARILRRHPEDQVAEHCPLSVGGAAPKS